MKKIIGGSVVVTAMFMGACSSQAEPSMDESVLLTATSSGGSSGSSGSSELALGSSSVPSDLVSHGRFRDGWALEFLPDTDYILVTERGGAMQMVDLSNDKTTSIEGVPEVHANGQAGMHDVIVGPTFEDDGTIYLSWVRDTDAGPQGVIGRGQLDTEGGTLTNLEVIWEQTPYESDAHFSLRMLIDEDNLFVTSGERQGGSPAQETDTNLGKVLRLTLDGEPALGNAFAGEGERADEIYTMGHRNPLGIATDLDGELWVSEMGPAGGDELNKLVEGENYGWPEASMGVHYDGTDIPDHHEGDGFRAPAEYWVPSISPGSLIIYKGSLYDEWTGNAFVGGLSGKRIVRIELDGDEANAVEEWHMGNRIRALEEGPDGSIWILEDGRNGRLYEMRPKEG